MHRPRGTAVVAVDTAVVAADTPAGVADSTVAVGAAVSAPWAAAFIRVAAAFIWVAAYAQVVAAFTPPAAVRGWAASMPHRLISQATLLRISGGMVGELAPLLTASPIMDPTPITDPARADSQHTTRQMAISGAKGAVRSATPMLKLALIAT